MLKLMSESATKERRKWRFNFFSHFGVLSTLTKEHRLHCNLNSPSKQVDFPQENWKKQSQALRCNWALTDATTNKAQKQEVEERMKWEEINRSGIATLFSNTEESASNQSSKPEDFKPREVFVAKNSTWKLRSTSLFVINKKIVRNDNTNWILLLHNVVDFFLWSA